jgi:hypothetical protein
MEATGVYWKPVWHILEGRFLLILANAAQVKNVPGRKSDVNDAAWLADLLAHGLIRESFVCTNGHACSCPGGLILSGGGTIRDQLSLAVTIISVDRCAASVASRGDRRLPAATGRA